MATSLVVILFSQLILFFFTLSEGGGLWEVYLFSLFVYIIGFFALIHAIFKAKGANVKNPPSIIIGSLLIILNLLFSFYFIIVGYSALNNTLIRKGAYILSKKPEQKFLEVNKTVESPKINSYVYWVHLKDQYENDCCIVNPSKQTTDEFYVFNLKEGASQQDYVGIVCSPDCDDQGKVIWQGPVTFTNGYLKLTPNGSEELNNDDFFKSSSEVYELEIYTAGCKNPACLVTKKSFSSQVTLDLKDNNLSPYFEYDVYVCESSCITNPPNWQWNPKKCKAGTFGMNIQVYNPASCF